MGWHWENTFIRFHLNDVCVFQIIDDPSTPAEKKNATDFILLRFKILCIIWEFHTIYFHHILSHPTNLPPSFLPDLYPRNYAQILNTEEDHIIDSSRVLLLLKISQGSKNFNILPTLSTVLKVPHNSLNSEHWLYFPTLSSEVFP